MMFEAEGSSHDWCRKVLRIAASTRRSPSLAATVRNPQPRAHPSLCLLPTQRGGRDVLDRLGDLGDLGRLRHLASANDPLVLVASLDERSEGPCLEPDERFGMGWLEAVRAAPA